MTKLRSCKVEKRVMCHPLSKHVTFSEKHVRVRITGLEMLVFGKI